MYKGKHIVDQSEEVIEINIGLDSSPRMMKIGNNTTLDERRYIIKFIHQYNDVFSWSYDDLKDYKCGIIQHTISLKEGE